MSEFTGRRLQRRQAVTTASRPSTRLRRSLNAHAVERIRLHHCAVCMNSRRGLCRLRHRRAVALCLAMCTAIRTSRRHTAKRIRVRKSASIVFAHTTIDIKCNQVRPCLEICLILLFLQMKILIRKRRRLRRTYRLVHNFHGEHFMPRDASMISTARNLPV